MKKKKKEKHLICLGLFSLYLEEEKSILHKENMPVS